MSGVIMRAVPYLKVVAAMRPVRVEEHYSCQE